MHHYWFPIILYTNDMNVNLIIKSPPFLPLQLSLLAVIVNWDCKLRLRFSSGTFTVTTVVRAAWWDRRVSLCLPPQASPPAPCLPGQSFSSNWNIFNLLKYFCPVRSSPPSSSTTRPRPPPPPHWGLPRSRRRPWWSLTTRSVMTWEITRDQILDNNDNIHLLYYIYNL